MRPLRYIHAAFLFAVGVVAGLLALGTLSNLWSGYLDSPISDYLLGGLPVLALSIGALVSAVLVLRR